ncbi:MAG TPA: HU family DNA-binding protein [Candidatus Acidoferrales bacterium]|nr:HU family DNA-binding protein [Candidatus Acidoferrales bacterium]
MAKTMTKSQLVRHLAENVDVPKKTAAALLDELVNTAVRETKAKGTFVIPGIGKLRKAHRKARMGRNPQTGAAIKIPAKTVARFRVSKVCKEAIVGKK